MNKKNIINLVIGLCFCPIVFFSQSIEKKDTVIKNNHKLFVGARFEKSVGFYWCNGLYAEYSSSKLLKEKLSIGISFVSSRLGSAINTNAVPYYELQASAIKYFRRSKQLKPFLKLNTGIAHVNYGSDLFNTLPQNAMLLSLEAGVAYDFNFPLRVCVEGGYNLLTGNGSSGLGTIYPIFSQISLAYKFCHSSK